MSQTHLLLNLAYTLPLALLAWLALRPRPIARQLLVLLTLPVFYVLHYQWSGALIGWPSADPLPDNFLLLGSQIQEPDRQGNKPGHIRLWIQADPASQPRAHEFAYDKELHAELAGARQRQSQGKQQFGRLVAESDADGRDGRAGPARQRFRLEDEKKHRPPPKLD